MVRKSIATKITRQAQTVPLFNVFRWGVAAYLTKPFEPDELLVVIANILKRVDRVI